MFSPKIVNGDLVFENGDFVMVEGDEELKQSVEMVLSTRQGEFFLIPSHGIVFDNLVGKDANEDEAREDLVEAISQENRISSIEDVIFNDNRKTRIRNIDLVLQKDTGEILQIEGVNVDA